MPIIEIIYITFVILAIAACVPQIRRLLHEKSSNEFQLGSWSIWAGSQMATLVYVASIQAYLLVLVNIAWVGFYTAMAILIIYYRRYPGGRRRLAEVAVPVES